MAGRIPQSFIDDLLSRLDIAEVVGARLPLKRSGDNFSARCPFHDEKTPSFTVSHSKQFYHCFGCGAHGSAIGFVMQYDNLEFPEAIEELAAGLGLEVPREGGSTAPRDGTRHLLELLQRCADFYRGALREHPHAVAYLKQRGVEGELARDFALGYAPPGWDSLARQVGDDAGLAAAGMLIERDSGGYYDRFRDRVVFPIRDRRGRPLGFGGRALGDATPKYLNSPETEVFHKRREVYGLHEAVRAGLDESPLLVVEGYMDVIALHQHGLTNAVATLGTAATREQLQRLFRETSELAFCFDGDSAGRRAAWRALETGLGLLQDGRELRFMLLPEGEDPDSYVRRVGGEAFREALAEAPTASEYLLATLRSQTRMGTIGGRAKLAELARPLLARLPQGVYGELLREQLAREVGGHSAQARAALAPPAAPRQPPPGAGPLTAPQRMTPLRLVIALLLRRPELSAGLDLPAELLVDEDDPGMRLLGALRSQIATLARPTAAALLERMADDPGHAALSRLALWEPAVDLDEAQSAELLDDARDKLVAGLYRRRCDALLALAEERDLSADEKQQLKELLRKSK